MNLYLFIPAVVLLTIWMLLEYVTPIRVLLINIYGEIITQSKKWILGATIVTVALFTSVTAFNIIDPLLEPDISSPKWSKAELRSIDVDSRWPSENTVSRIILLPVPHSKIYQLIITNRSGTSTFKTMVSNKEALILEKRLSELIKHPKEGGK